MYNRIMVFGVFVVVVLLAGCGLRTEVPPAHVGKILTDSGLQEGIIPPSKIRLEGFCFQCDELVLAEASDLGVSETMRIFMPKDQLNLQVDVRGVYSISPNEANTSKIFARLKAEPTDESRVHLITMSRVYETYARQVVREATRTAFSEYSILQVMENRDAVASELTDMVRNKLSSTPITIQQFGLADIQPPDLIIQAQEAKREREIAIEKEEAEKLVRLTKAEADLEVAKKQREIDLTEAGTQVLVQRKLAEGVSDAWLKQRAIRVLEEMAASDNKVIFMPTGALENPAIMLGALQEARR